MLSEAKQPASEAEGVRTLRSAQGDRASRPSRSAGAARSIRGWGALVDWLLSPAGLILLTLIPAALGFWLRWDAVAHYDYRLLWERGWQASTYSRNDLLGMYSQVRAGEGGIPYLTGNLEYPVLIGVYLFVMARLTDSLAGYFALSMVGLTLLAMATTWALGQLGRTLGTPRPWLLAWALAPTLALYLQLNWDVLAILPGVLALWAYLRGRPGWAGICLALGFSAKAFPLLFLPILAYDLWQQRGRAGLKRLLWGFAVPVALLNIPILILAPVRFLTFYGMNVARPASFDNFWYPLSDLLNRVPIPYLGGIVVGLLSFGLFVLAARWIYKRYRARSLAEQRAGHSLVELCFSLVLLFLLLNKVYSPQYTLWVLPFCAGGLVPLPLFLALEAVDVAIFVAIMQYFAQGPDLAPWLLALSFARHGLLLWLLLRLWWPRAQALRRAALTPRPPVPDLGEGESARRLLRDR